MAAKDKGASGPGFSGQKELRACYIRVRFSGLSSRSPFYPFSTHYSHNLSIITIKNMIWKTPLSLEGLNNVNASSMGGFLGIEFTDFGDDFITARMPVNERTVQPFGILHGGASCVLAESLGSVASTVCIDLTMQSPVGLEINASHLSAGRQGEFVYGTVRPVRVGRTMHVWNIEINDERGKPVCLSRLTVAIIDRKS